MRLNLLPKRNELCPCDSGKKYKKCCALNSHVSMLPELLAGGRFAELEHSARLFIARDADAAVAWQFLAIAQWKLGKDPTHALERTADLLPRSAEAQTNLGNAARARGDLAEAVKRHRQALAIDNDYSEGYNNLGSALRDLGALAAAVDCYSKAVALKPDWIMAMQNLGDLQIELGRNDEAMQTYRRVLRIDSQLTAPYVLLAQLHAEKGEFLEADAMLNRALEIDPELPEAWAARVRWRSYSQGDEQWLAGAQRVLGNPLAPRREAHLRYALGKYFDDTGEYDQAFPHYERAHALAKKFTNPYDQLHTTREVDRIIRSYGCEWMQRAAGRGNASEQPVFIVGLWRSGTTLVEQILASHPSVFGAGEVGYWGEVAATDAEQPFEPTNSALQSLATRYLAALTRHAPDALRITDKMSLNFARLGILHATFPRARIVQLQRNALDNCLSIYFQDFRHNFPYAHDLTDLAHYYGEYRRLMAHWRAVLPTQAIFTVDYEQLVADPKYVTRALLEFLGLPWDAACMVFHRNLRQIRTASKWQARQSITTASVGRWRNYEQHLGPLRSLNTLG